MSNVKTRYQGEEPSVDDQRRRLGVFVPSVEDTGPLPVETFSWASSLVALYSSVGAGPFTRGHLVGVGESESSARGGRLYL